ncbi:Uu.00g025180.m01.CDS01 [Anthostomella pinea]|uniref:Uu.00g025180.m01.CDS01 n=1 Tax=Anthostomella pinea TaxID=933095 RepID=A0AAI8YCF9_9PEZI|nr:Uu.00g025180.m01.CDS01 [Anthostomella pinea]
MEKIKPTVAVIGAGSSGLSMLKTLREDGFKVTCFERRSQVGGLWAYTEDKSMTTALEITTASISKYTCGMSDFPMPDKYPHHLAQWEFQEYMESYAKHFDLFRDIVFGATLKRATRNDTDTKWRLELDIDGQPRVEEFDKVALCHGYQTAPNMPEWEGSEKFQGTMIHSQEYRSAEDYQDKKVVVVGLGPTAADVISDVIPVASKVYTSHRRGAFMFPLFSNGTPADLQMNWRRRQMGLFMQRSFPRLTRWLGDFALKTMQHRMYGKFDPAWRLEPFPSITLSVRGTPDSILGFLKDGSLETLHGIKRFTGPRSIEFSDGTILDDVDAVISATGYGADFSAVPFVETSRPTDYGGPDLVRLWMNLFPPKYADSMVLLCHSTYGKNNGFSFSDVSSMAVSNVFRGVHPLPPPEEMEKQIDEHQEWVASRWRLDNAVDPSSVRGWVFQGFLHEAAGTGMENLGWGWKGWKFWLRDRQMSNLMNHGVETAHAFRYFETGKRKTWPGARDAIIHANDAVKVFPIQTPPM